ncbi:hypothetical protein [Telmatospirillum sp.]|uniref:hypothetical protein n=1 Tax=Telmatospirillum sp. TaxID=2079197 RepID=UPI00284BC867|nr:hypothetical protein [Telmatospirillum sp.]MDR3438963.1 hypothetical protein [Telmatospirillum sp.]
MSVEQTEENVLVNKRELATKILKCSLPTLSALMERYPDFPVHQRGANGVEWLFDAVAVSEFLEKIREDERRAAETRSEFFNQFSLPIDAPEFEGQKELTPTQRASLAKARLAERKLAVESGMLISKAEMRQTLTGALGKLGRFLETLPGQVARQHGLPEEVARSMSAAIDEQRRVFVKEMQEALAAEALNDGGN